MIGEFVNELQTETQKLTQAAPGTRNEILYGALRKLLPLAHGTGLFAKGVRDDVVLSLTDAAKKSGLSDREIHETVSSVERQFAASFCRCATGSWISVAERMPEQGMNVLVSDGSGWSSVAMWDRDYWLSEDTVMGLKVAYWATINSTPHR